MKSQTWLPSIFYFIILKIVSFFFYFQTCWRGMNRVGKRRGGNNTFGQYKCVILRWNHNARMTTCNTKKKEPKRYVLCFYHCCLKSLYAMMWFYIYLVVFFSFIMYLIIVLIWTRCKLLAHFYVHNYLHHFHLLNLNYFDLQHFHLLKRRKLIFNHWLIS